ADIIIDLLPTQFRRPMTEWAIESKTNIVNTSFQSNIKEYENDAKMAGIIVMPESGLDPGIDLILAGNAVKQFDEVHDFHSACGGVPTKEACNNPINYKVSWLFEMALAACKRPASIIVEGQKISIPGDEIFNYVQTIDIPGVGTMDRYPNGFSTTYARLLGIRDTIKNMGRYTLRWPGYAQFWKTMVQLGLLEDEPVMGISPKKFIAKVLEPRLQYKDDEKDLIILRNEISGIKDNKPKKIVQQVIDTRDLKTGFMAMNRTVGFTASIVAQMILDKKITGAGMLNPGIDVPYQEFLEELKKRNIKVEETIR
ncbi:MAG: saccharopine dehydrogenase family protein, partial [Candidatus Thorarchaeota archaeon]